MAQIDQSYLSPTDIIDSNHMDIVKHAMEVVGGCIDPIERAVRLFYSVRDGIWYDPYYPFYLPEHYRASNILKTGRGFCVCKASLLCALGRTCKIPSRVGFCTVRNHLATKQLIEFMGTDLFVYHGYVEFYLEGKWIKATPAFNSELCERHGTLPLEFDGHQDSMFQSYNLEKKQFMEYMEDHGTYADIPVYTIMRAWENTYGKARVRSWVVKFEKSGGTPIADFDQEEIWKRQ